MLSLNCPLNLLSFGSVSQSIIRELHNRGEKINLFPIGGNIDLSSYNIDQDFQNYISQSINRAHSKFKKTDPSLKIWHLRGSEEAIGQNPSLLSFHETDSASPAEINLAANKKCLFVTSQYTKKVFEDFGADNVVYFPLGIDQTHFFEKPETPYLANDVTTWCVMGKLEERKQTLRTIKIWSELYGNNRKHQLIVLAFNPFMDQKMQENAIAGTLGKPFFNIIFLPQLKTALEVNDTLNAADIFISLSRLEGFNIPLATAMYLGKTCVVLDQHVHRDYCNAENSILVPSIGKVPAIDNVFFFPNSPYNCGNWFDTTNELIIKGFQEAEKSINIINNRKQSKFYSKAKEIINTFNFKNTVDAILENV